MKIRSIGGLPFVSIVATVRGKEIRFEDALLDTGSAGTVLLADRLFDAGVRAEAADRLVRIRGIGGSETVFLRRVERVVMGDLEVTDFVVQVGGLSYGFELDAIVGMDLLLGVGAVIDLARLEVRGSTG